MNKEVQDIFFFYRKLGLCSNCKRHFRACECTWSQMREGAIKEYEKRRGII